MPDGRCDGQGGRRSRCCRDSKVQSGCTSCDGSHATRHAAGEGAAAFARAHGFRAIDDPDHWFTRPESFEFNRLPAHSPQHGTVGCVVRDGAGRMAAATSTGVYSASSGRVGDSPLIRSEYLGG